jgi:hypothetical protein
LTKGRRKVLWKKRSAVPERNEGQVPVEGNPKTRTTKGPSAGAVQTGDLERREENLLEDER